MKFYLIKGVIMTKEKISYEKPELIIHGDLKVFTQGSVSGGMETGERRFG